MSAMKLAVEASDIIDKLTADIGESDGFPPEAKIGIALLGGLAKLHFLLQAEMVAGLNALVAQHRSASAP